MTWKALSKFSTSGTNFPIESLTSLRFEKTYRAIQDFLDLEEHTHALANDLAEKIQTHLYSDSTRKAWQKLKKNLGQKKSISTHFIKIKNDDSAPLELREGLEQYELRHHECLAQLEKLEPLFQEELAHKRKGFWELTQHPFIQETLFHLNPDFLNRLHAYLGDAGTQKRDKKMRERERTLASYFARICAKNSASGPMGPSSAATFSDQKKNLSLAWGKTAEKEYGLKHKEAFFSHWGAREIAKKISENASLRLSLPLRLHPVARLQENTLTSMIHIPGHPFLPTKPETSISPELFALLEESDQTLSGNQLLQKISSETDAAKMRLEILTLLNERFLLDGLYIPPGLFHPLQYLISRLESSSEREVVEKWLNLLKQFEDLRVRFSTGTLKEKESIFHKVGDLFSEQIHHDTSRGEGKYYADRYLIYEDCSRNHAPIEIGGNLEKQIFQEYTFALELLSPEWLLLIVPPAINSRLFLEKLKKNPKYIEQGPVLFFQGLLNNQFSGISEELKEDARGIEWLSNIIELKQLSKELLSQVDESEKEVLWSETDPLIQAYRKKFREAVASADLPLPIFASGPGLQLSAENLEAINQGEYTIIFDSVIFGNSMNLTTLNYFATDRTDQTQQTELALKSMCNLSTGRRADFLVAHQQDTKFSPWYIPGLDIECLAPSSKDSENVAPLNELRLSLNDEVDFEVDQKGKNTPLRYLFPHTTRLSTKLIHPNFEVHCPRIRLGNTVLQREQWKLNTCDWSTPEKSQNSDLSRFIEALRNQRKFGLPDTIFVDPSGPKKNIFIDFRNFFLVEILSSLLGDNETFRVSEMLPSDDHFWMPCPHESGHLNMEFSPFLYFDPDHGEEESSS